MRTQKQVDEFYRLIKESKKQKEKTNKFMKKCYKIMFLGNGEYK